MTSNAALTIIQHNVQHWQNKKMALCNIYNSINPDIILINDTSNRNSDPFKIFNYNTFQSNKNNSLHSGIGIAIRKTLPFRLIDDFHSDFLAVSVPTPQGNIIIATTYIPPRDQYINFIDFQKILNRPEPVYIIADINAKHRTLGNTYNNTVGKSINMLIEQNKCKFIGPNFPTYISHNTASHPDIVITNNHTIHNIHLKPGPITPSDHIPIIAQISANPIQIPIKPRKSFHRADWDSYKLQLSEINPPTDPHPTLEDIDEYIGTWTRAISTASDQNIPNIKHRTIPGVKQTHKIKVTQIQYTATVQYIKENGPTILLNQRLIFLRQELHKEYRRLQEETWTGLIKELDNTDDPTTFWRSIRRMQGNDKQTIPYLRDEHKRQLDTPEEKEPLFRQHWQTIFTNNDEEDNNFDYDHIEHIEQQLEQNIDKVTPQNTGDITRFNNTNLSAITTRELKNTLSKFKQKAPGPTGITSLQLKNLPDNMVQYLLYIYNNALSAGYFPDSYKHAIMIFLPKANTSQHLVKNYRPISLLDVQGKLFDKILNKRITHHLESRGITNLRQHGFRKHRGTHTALATFQETIAKNLAKGMKTDVVLRDVSKAFDKVWHTGLKHKILQLDIHPALTETLCDFITDRTASIRISSHTGPPFPLESGVPQGACLSPTLYSFYTHDIPPPLEDTDYICFADDISQIISTPNYKATAKTTEHAIRQINTFENKWKICTNQSKFTIIPMNRRKTEDIIIDDKLFPYTNKGKILGLNISTNGIAPQIVTRRAMALAQLNKLYRFRHLSTKNKRLLYMATVRSTLTYPTIPLHTVSKTAMSTLQKIQNKALRFITNTHWQEFKTSEQLHNECNLPPINTYLHEQSKNIWENIETNHPDMYNNLEIPPDLIHKIRKKFPSSKQIAQNTHPQPIYK